MSELRCETCRYWDKSFEECHLGPPTIHPDNLIGIWPGTVASDWCGEHEARMELPIAEDRAQLMADVISGKVTGHKEF